MPEWISTALTVVAAAVGAYAAVQRTLGDILARLNNVERMTERAHDRIDDLVSNPQRRVANGR